MPARLRPHLASIAIVAGIPVRNGQLLLGLRARHRRSFAGYWDVIGGHVEAGESVEQAFLRELREEIGIVPNAFKHWGAWDVQGPIGMLVMTVFRVDEWGGEPHLANDEHERLAWFDRDAAIALPNLASDHYPDLFRSILA